MVNSKKKRRTENKPQKVDGKKQRWVAKKNKGGQQKKKNKGGQQINPKDGQQKNNKGG